MVEHLSLTFADSKRITLSNVLLCSFSSCCSLLPFACDGDFTSSSGTLSSLMEIFSSSSALGGGGCLTFLGCSVTKVYVQNNENYKLN